MSSIFKWLNSTTPAVPLLISAPHCGSEIPKEISQQFKNPNLTSEDTDWFIDQLYDFAPELGVSIISAKYSRYVIDLNRSRDNQNLYSDGRQITGLVPLNTFAADTIYPKGKEPDEEETHRRVIKYYDPYHAALNTRLQELKAKFGRVLLFDAHSIKSLVPSIRKERFPHMILGDNDGKSAAGVLTKTTLDSLRSQSAWNVSHNNPFKGGWITRNYGQPQSGVHALQLEMSQDVYMDESGAPIFDHTHAKAARDLLHQTFVNLIRSMESLS
jgi:N-formylglutamate deformylase